MSLSWVCETLVDVLIDLFVFGFDDLDCLKFKLLSFLSLINWIKYQKIWLIFKTSDKKTINKSSQESTNYFKNL